MAKRKVLSNPEETVSIPMPISIEEAKEMGFSRSSIVYRKIGPRRYPCIMVSGSNQQRADWIREFDNERKADDREQRCLIADGHGSFITCPESNICSQCPKIQSIDFDAFRPLSLELLAEDREDGGDGFEPAASGNIEEDVAAYVTLKNLIQYLREVKGEEYALILQMLFDQASTTEIAKALDKPWSTADYMIRKTRQLAQDYTGLSK